LAGSLLTQRERSLRHQLYCRLTNGWSKSTTLIHCAKKALTQEIKMKKSTAMLSTLVALALVSSLAAYAADQTATSGTSEAKAPTLVDKLKASYSATFYGPSITNPVGSLQPDSWTGDGSSPLVLKNKVYLGYKFTKDIALGPVFYWKNYTREKQFILQDPYVKLTHNKLYTNDKFNIYGELDVSAPVSTQSRNDKLITSVTGRLDPSYQIGSSRFSLYMCAAATANIYAASTPAKTAGKLNRYTFYAGPALNYQIRSNLTAFVLYELNAKYTNANGFEDDGTDLEPGISWDITKNLNFSPALDIKTGNRISLGTTSFIASLSWKLL